MVGEEGVGANEFQAAEPNQSDSFETSEDLQKQDECSCCRMIKSFCWHWFEKSMFYAQGTFDNGTFKARYHGFAGSLKLLDTQLQALITNAGTVADSKTSLTAEDLQREVYNFFRGLDQIIAEHRRLISMCKALDIDEFLVGYKKGRTDVCRALDKEVEDKKVDHMQHKKEVEDKKVDKKESSGGTMPLHWVQVSLGEVSQHVKSLEIMSDFVKHQLQLNDELMFKGILVMLNVATFFGTYVYNTYYVEDDCH